MGTKRTSRKKQYAMPLHKRKALVRVHVSKDLRKELKKRAVTVKKGDTVRIMRGKHKGKEGAVVRVSYKKGVVFVQGISRINSRGKDVFVPLNPSNLMLIGRKSKE